MESFRSYEDVVTRAADGRQFYSAFLKKLRQLDNRLDALAQAISKAQEEEAEVRDEMLTLYNVT